MKDLLISITKGLVDNPDAVSVDVDEPNEEGVTVYHLHVAEDDMGRVIGKQGRTTGIGMGQTNRIWAAKQAIEHAADEAKGSVMASDAFFPFDDCVTVAAEAGITAIIQPGGSLRDEDSVKAANAAGIAMVFVGDRHFKH